MLNELFSRMMIEPSILMIGNKYKDISTEVMNYSWNAIITTNCELKLSAALANDKRCITDISSKDDIKANIMEQVILMMNMGFALMWLLLLLRMQDMI